MVIFFFVSNESEIKRSSPVDGMHFFNLHEMSVAISRNRRDFKLLHSLLLSRL